MRCCEIAGGPTGKFPTRNIDKQTQSAVLGNGAGGSQRKSRNEVRRRTGLFSSRNRDLSLEQAGSSTSTLPFTPNSLLRKDLLGAHGVNAYVPVHQLSDIDIDRHAGQHVRIVTAQVLLLDEEVDHVAHRKCGRLFQIGTETHSDITGRCFRARPEQMLILMHDEAEGAAEKGFHGGDIDFPVTLSGMAGESAAQRRCVEYSRNSLRHMRSQG
jgi:hypothetical protein